ncbi:MAG: transposase zinc-binding domain-containing protein [Candidatus Sulfotelmatobacter sp.]
MSRPQLEVADIIRSAGADFIARNRHWLRWTHLKVLLAIARCRTAALGGHIDECTGCDYYGWLGRRLCLIAAFCPKTALLAAKTGENRKDNLQDPFRRESQNQKAPSD